MRALNRHFHFKWKRRRRDKFGHKCNRADCRICHYKKVHGVKPLKEKIQDEKLKDERLSD